MSSTKSGNFFGSNGSLVVSLKWPGLERQSMRTVRLEADGAEEADGDDDDDILANQAFLSLSPSTASGFSTSTTSSFGLRDDLFGVKAYPAQVPSTGGNIFAGSPELWFNSTSAATLLTETFNTTNITPTSSPEDDYQFYYFYKTEQLTFLWILFAMIVFGNCSVLITLLMSKNRKTRMNFFIMHLAIADLMVGLINVLTDIAWKTTVGFYAGNIACKIVRFLQVLVTYSSTYVLVSLSIDRYDAITHPLNFSGSWRRARLLVFSAWGLSLIFSVPAVFLNQETMVKGQPQCWIALEPWQWQVYITLVALSVFFAPAIIISACYSIIVHTIWAKSRMMGFPKAPNKSPPKPKLKKEERKKLKEAAAAAALQQNNGSAEGEGASPCSTPAPTPASAHSSNHEMNSDFKRASSRGVIPRAKIKTVKMTFVIIFVFILCWSPYFVWDLLQVYGFIPLSQTTIAVSTFIQSMAPLNSAANPIIYCLFSTHICRNLRKLSFMRCLSRALCMCCPNLQLRPLRGSAMKRLDYATMNSTTTRSSGSRNTQRFSLTSQSQSSSKGSTLKKTVVFRNSLDEVPETSSSHSQLQRQEAEDGETVAVTAFDHHSDL